MEKEQCDKNTYCCWINDRERILSFHYIDGYVPVTFETRNEFMNYCYKKTLMGYRAT